MINLGIESTRFCENPSVYIKQTNALCNDDLIELTTLFFCNGTNTHLTYATKKYISWIVLKDNGTANGGTCHKVLNCARPQENSTEPKKLGKFEKSNQ